jgi:hypothetical protein
VWGAPVRSWNEDSKQQYYLLLFLFSYTQLVPAYDGRKPFKLSTYGSLRPYNDELDANSAAMVIFTVSSYKNNRARESDELVLSLNIQDVVLLADYDSATEPSTISSSEPIGVDVEEVAENVDLVVEDVEEEEL